MKLRFAAIVLPVMMCSSITFATTATSAAAPAVPTSAAPAAHHTMMKHHVMAKQAMNHPISIEHALKLVKKAGYNGVSKIESEHGYYEVKAMSAQGKKTKLKVDMMTGAITQDNHIF